jgi:hypothetical protein
MPCLSVSNAAPHNRVLQKRFRCHGDPAHARRKHRFCDSIVRLICWKIRCAPAGRSVPCAIQRFERLKIMARIMAKIMAKMLRVVVVVAMVLTVGILHAQSDAILQKRSAKT